MTSVYRHHCRGLQLSNKFFFLLKICQNRNFSVKMYKRRVFFYKNVSRKNEFVGTVIGMPAKRTFEKTFKMSRFVTPRVYSKLLRQRIRFKIKSKSGLRLFPNRPERISLCLYIILSLKINDGPAAVVQTSESHGFAQGG